MSQAHPENVNIAEEDIRPGIGDHLYPPPPVQNQALRDASNFADGSGPILSMYLEMATEEDKKMAEGWKADANGILIFTGLFSAAVASLISVSIQDIRPNPQDTSNFYLANIYQTVSNPNQSGVPSSPPTSPPPFSPPNYAVWVNSLWFMSFVISLTCALLATLLQQWARRYLKITQPRYSPHKRARIRAFFSEGVNKSLLPWVVEALPTLLHVSLFLFLAGLAVFLWNINLTISKSVLSWVGMCTALYGCITFIPIIRHDSPYRTPLSLPAWHIVTGITYAIYRVLRWFIGPVYFRYGAWSRAWRLFKDLETSHRKLLMQGMQKTAEKTALESPPEIDTRAFLWTFDSLDEDHELECFFSGLPGFRSSKVIYDPLPRLTNKQREKLSMALIGLLDRTLSSDLLPDQVKRRRIAVCFKAVNPTDITEQVLWRFFNRTFLEDQYEPVSAEVAHLVRGWGRGKGLLTTMLVQATVIGIVAKAQLRDDSWFALASSELSIPESVLRYYATQGDTLSLVILTQIARHQFSRCGENSWPPYMYFWVLRAASRSFDVRNTSPQQQHSFCALWNQIVRKAQNDNESRISTHNILGPIRRVYTILHQDTDAAAPTHFSAPTDNAFNSFPPAVYPLCNIPGHHSDTIQRIYGDSASASTGLNDDDALSPAPFFSPDATSSLIPASPHVPSRLGHADVPPLDNTAEQLLAETLRVLVTSPTTIDEIMDVVNSHITPDPTPETLASIPPLFSTSPPTAIALQHNTDPLTPSDASNFSSSSSSNSVLDNQLLTEPHSSIVATTALGASLVPTSAPDVGTAAKDDGGSQPGLRKEKDAIELLEVNRGSHANSTDNLEPPPQSPPPRSVNEPEVAIAGPSLQEPNAERTGDHPPHTSHGRYDMV